MIICPLVDGGITEYTDCSYESGGCNTCGYGRTYSTDIDVTLTHKRINISSESNRDYICSQGDIMRLMFVNYDTIKQMTEEAFCNFFKDELQKINPNINVTIH